MKFVKSRQRAVQLKIELFAKDFFSVNFISSQQHAGMLALGALLKNACQSMNGDTDQRLSYLQVLTYVSSADE
jgi:hypothetical protein